MKRNDKPLADVYYRNYIAESCCFGLGLRNNTHIIDLINNLGSLAKVIYCGGYSNKAEMKSYSISRLEDFHEFQIKFGERGFSDVFFIVDNNKTELSKLLRSEYLGGWVLLGGPKKGMDKSLLKALNNEMDVEEMHTCFHFASHPIRPDFIRQSSIYVYFTPMLSEYYGALMPSREEWLLGVLPNGDKKNRSDVFMSDEDSFAKSLSELNAEYKMKKLLGFSRFFLRKNAGE